MFETVKLTTNADLYKSIYSGHGIGFDASGNSSLSNGSVFGKIVIIFGTHMSSSVHMIIRKQTFWSSTKAR